MQTVSVRQTLSNVEASAVVDAFVTSGAASSGFVGALLGALQIPKLRAHMVVMDKVCNVDGSRCYVPASRRRGRRSLRGAEGAEEWVEEEAEEGQEGAEEGRRRLQASDPPTGQPSTQPSGVPSGQPSRQPTRQPTRQPSGQPSGLPSARPSGEPTAEPSAAPTTGAVLILYHIEFADRSIGTNRAVSPASFPDLLLQALPAFQALLSQSHAVFASASALPPVVSWSTAQVSPQPTGQPTSQPTLDDAAGSRLPALFFCGSEDSVLAACNGTGLYLSYYPSGSNAQIWSVPLPVGVWSSVQIQVDGVNNLLSLRVTGGASFFKSVPFVPPRAADVPFRRVSVFASSPWQAPASASLRNLRLYDSLADSTAQPSAVTSYTIGPFYLSANASSVAMRADEADAWYSPQQSADPSLGGTAAPGSRAGESVQALFEASPLVALGVFSGVKVQRTTMYGPASSGAAATMVVWTVTFLQSRADRGLTALSITPVDAVHPALRQHGASASYYGYSLAGAVSAGNAAVSYAPPNAIGGTFALEYDGHATLPLTFSAPAAEVEAALMGLVSVRDAALGVGRVVVSRFGPQFAPEGGLGWYVAFVESAAGAPEAGPTGQAAQQQRGGGTVYGGSASTAVGTRPGATSTFSTSTGSGTSSASSPGTSGSGLHCRVSVANSRLTGLGARMETRTLRQGPSGFGLRVGGGLHLDGAAAGYSILAAEDDDGSSDGGNSSGFSPYLLLSGGPQGLSAALSGLEYRPGQDWSGGVKVVLRVWDSTLSAGAGGAGSGGASGSGSEAEGAPETAVVVAGRVLDAPLVPAIFWRGAQV